MIQDLFQKGAEVELLSLLLNNPEKIFEIKTLNSDMFSSSPNMNIFSNMMILRGDGITPTYDILLNVLKSNGSLNACGGEEYLSILRKQDINVDTFELMINLIINSHRKRELIRLSGKIPELLTDEFQVDGAIYYIKDQLDRLLANSGGESVHSMKDALSTTWEDLVTKVQNPDQRTGLRTGYTNLDNVTGGYLPGDLWIVAGRPSMGKSASMCNSILKGAKTGVSSLVFSLEMNEKILMQRLLSIETGISISNIRFGLVNQSEMDRIQDAVRLLKTLPIYIDTNYSMSLNYITSTIRKFHELYNVRVAHLDYIQLLAERDEGATHELGRISREFKLLSNELGITSVIYSQLNRGVEMREDKRPILSDLRQSGNLEEDADLAVFLYRDVVYHQNTKDKNLLEFIIRKHRNGPIGTLFMDFNMDSNIITEK